MSDAKERFGEINHELVEDFGKQRVTLVFNRLNGAYVATSTQPLELHDLNDPLCIYVSDEMDMAVDEVVGDLTIHEDGTWTANYKIQPEESGELLTIYEEMLDAIVAEKITKRYTVVEQINIIAKAVKQLTDAAGVENEELEEYLDYVNLVKETNKLHKQFYQQSEDYTYVSNAEVAEQEARRYEGGLHERIGGRPVEGGIVF